MYHPPAREIAHFARECAEFAALSLFGGALGAVLAVAACGVVLGWIVLDAGKPAV